MQGKTKKVTTVCNSSDSLSSIKNEEVNTERQAYTAAWVDEQEQPENIAEAIGTVERLFEGEGERGRFPGQDIITWLDEQQQPENIAEAIGAVERLFEGEGERGGVPDQDILTWLDEQQQPENIAEAIEAVERLFEDVIGVVEKSFESEAEE